MKYQFPDVRLIIFSKPPVAGKCKSRLVPMLGEKRAAELQQELIQLCIEEHAVANLCETELWCATEIDHPVFIEIQQQYPVKLFEQRGDNLGERMFNALNQDSNKKYSIIIGTDCPVLTRDYIKAAIESLASGKDIAIGPAEDGGYVLLGVTKPQQGIFEDIRWGGEDVYIDTLHRIRELKLSFKSLETLWDLDRPEDYLRYLQLFRQNNINKYNKL